MINSKYVSSITKNKKTIVFIPLAKEFNESIAMDLKNLNEKLILHPIDYATRFSAACAIPSKRRDVIISAVLTIWIAVFGSTKRILLDNGKDNEDFREMGEKWVRILDNKSSGWVSIEEWDKRAS